MRQTPVIIRWARATFDVGKLTPSPIREMLAYGDRQGRIEKGPATYRAKECLNSGPFCVSF